ncbi:MULTISPECIES: phycobilisome rod-core linker polypeptide [unclassified Microcoleus]|nr:MULTISPECIES: phycobilisome rod-core linker polypeptide [unclassified Microcoleus]
MRAIAQSENYRKKFFYPNSQTRLIELNYKHLCGPLSLRRVGNCFLR